MIKIRLTERQAESLYGQIAKDLDYIEKDSKTYEDLIDLIERLKGFGIGKDWSEENEKNA